MAVNPFSARTCAWLLGAAWLAWVSVASAAPLHATHFKPHPSDKVFEGPVLRFEVSIARPELDSLRREPRKTVPATLRIGSNTGNASACA